MKRLIFLIGIIFFLGFVKSEAKNSSLPQVRVYFDFFYNSLQPYGIWMELGPGIYAWKPTRITFGWKPYSLGRWIWTSYGWYWDSYEPYGWAVYHYGRWYYDNYYGWIWIPDYQWGPAWVEWRYDDDYIGWAPLPPYATFSITFGISFSTNWISPYYYWNFVRYKHFYHSNVYHYYINDSYKKRIFGSSKYRNNYSYESGNVVNYGVDRDFIERKTGSRITETRLRNVTDPQEITRNRTRDEVVIYRPSREDFERTQVRDFNFQRADRSTSLDLNKIERIETRRSDDRRTNRNEETRDIRNETRQEERSNRILNPSGRENNESMNNRTRPESPTYTPERRDNSRDNNTDYWQNNRRENRIQRDERTRENNSGNFETTRPRIEYRNDPPPERNNRTPEFRIERRNEDSRTRDNSSAPSNEGRSRTR